MLWKGATIQPVFEDSFLIKGGIPEPQHALAYIQQRVQFVPRENEEMRYRGSVLPRDKAFLVRSPVNAEGEPTELFKYNYPGFQYRSMLHYQALSKHSDLQQALDNMMGLLSFCDLPVAFNHVILTRYEQADDLIGFHMDKTLDITDNTPIISLSLGDSREMHFCRPGNEGRVVPDYVLRLDAGDIFVMGPKTNEKLKHSIAAVSKEREIQRNGVPASAQISIVLRNIKTKLTRAQMIRLAARPARADPQRDLTEEGIEPHPGPGVRYALTFGEQSEIHVGCPITGDGLAAHGFTVQELESVRNKYKQYGTVHAAGASKYVCVSGRKRKRTASRAAPPRDLTDASIPP